MIHPADPADDTNFAQFRRAADAGLLLPFALHGRAVKHISEVSPSDRQGYICPKCRERVIPRLGRQRRHSFAHTSGSLCVGGLETGLHLAAKAVLCSASAIALPGHRVEYESVGRDLFGPYVFTYGSAVAEDRQGNLRPDVRLEAEDGEIVLVEVYVTHRVDEAKRATLRDLGLRCVEVDVTPAIAGPRFSWDTLRSLLLESHDPRWKNWLYMPGEEVLLAELHAEMREIEKRERESLVERQARDAAERVENEQRLLARMVVEREALGKDGGRQSACYLADDIHDSRVIRAESGRWQFFLFHQYIERPFLRELEHTKGTPIEIDAEYLLHRLTTMHTGLLVRPHPGPLEKRMILQLMDRYLRRLEDQGLLAQVTPGLNGKAWRVVRLR